MRIVSVLLALCSVTLGAACSGGSEVMTMTDGTRVVAGPGSSGGTDAVQEGTLVVVEGDCLGIVIGDEDYLAVFPSGTKLVDGESAIKIGSKRYEVGDEITGTGGAYTEPFAVQVPDFPAECETPEIVVFDQVG